MKLDNNGALPYELAEYDVPEAEAMAEYVPTKIICAEQGFADDSALSNAHYILRDKGIELKFSIGG